MPVTIRHHDTGAVLHTVEGDTLVGANLYGAALSGANLYGADGVHDAGHDARGYRFWAWRHPNGHVVYRAGCREWASLDAARAHYSEGYRRDGDPAECLARLAVLEHAARRADWPVA